jgi:hypothetical protein
MVIVNVAPDAFSGCRGWKVALVVGEGCALVEEERRPGKGRKGRAAAASR